MSNLLNLGLIALALNVQLFSNAPLSKSNTIDNLDKFKVLDINFDSQDITNLVNGKKYNSKTNTSSLVGGIKGKGFEFKNDYIQIPSSDLNISNNDEYLTVSFKYKFGTGDNIQMITAFGWYDLYYCDGKLGFNTGNGDIFGIPFKPSNDFIDVVAVFHKTDVTRNKLYLDGARQTLNHINPGTPYDTSQEFSKDFYIGFWGAEQNEKYRVSDNSLIDEIKIYKTNVTDEQVLNIGSQHNIPEIRLTKNNNHIRLDWASQILDSDILYKIGFENGQLDPSFIWGANKVGDNTGGQKITSEQKYEGFNSAYVPRTKDGMGNHYNFPSTSSDRNIMEWPYIKIPNGTKLSLSFSTKNTSNGQNYVSFGGDGGLGYSTSKSPAKYTKDFNKGSTSLTIDMQNEFFTGSFLTTDIKDVFTHGRLQVDTVINNPDGTATLNLRSPTNFDVKKGDNVRLREYRGTWYFGEKMIESTDWQLQNLNTTVNDHFDYDISERGGTLYMTTNNEAGLYVDDIKFGYATKVKIFRDNTQIYEGYGSEYQDTSATDKTKPSNVSNINNTMALNSNKTRTLNISFNSALDNGTTYNYQIKGLSKSGETPLSAIKKITTTSGVKGYSYIIDKINTTIPDNTVDTTSGTISQNINQTDSGIYFLHIKTIDNEGNASDTIHHQINIPVLSATSNNEENLIRLDWTNSSNGTYRVFRKNETDNTIQNISTTNNFLDDINIIDTIAPNKVDKISHFISNDGLITFKFDEPSDNTMPYSYYVETLSNDGSIKSISNVANASIKRNIKGYSYKIDTISDSEPDNEINANDYSEITGAFDSEANDMYLHIKSIDASNNASITTHYKISPPEISMIKLDTKYNDTLFKNNEPIPISWSIIGATNFKKLNVELKKVDSNELYNYSVSTNAKSFIVPPIPKGIYKITINAVDFLDRPIKSNELTIRVNTFLNTGLVTSKVIDSPQSVNYVKVALSQSIPKNTECFTKIYIQNNQGIIDMDNFILIDNSNLNKTIKLPHLTKKMIFETTFKGTQDYTPFVDKIEIYAK